MAFSRQLLIRRSTIIIEIIRLIVMGSIREIPINVIRY